MGDGFYMWLLFIVMFIFIGLAGVKENNNNVATNKIVDQCKILLDKQK